MAREADAVRGAGVQYRAEVARLPMRRCDGANRRGESTRCPDAPLSKAGLADGIAGSDLRIFADWTHGSGSPTRGSRTLTRGSSAPIHGSRTPTRRSSTPTHELRTPPHGSRTLTPGSSSLPPASRTPTRGSNSLTPGSRTPPHGSDTSTQGSRTPIRGSDCVNLGSCALRHGSGTPMHGSKGLTRGRSGSGGITTSRGAQPESGQVPRNGSYGRMVELQSFQFPRKSMYTFQICVPSRHWWL